MEDYLTENSNIEIVATADNKSDDSVATDATAAMIQGHPEMNLVTSINATGAGVAAAIRQTGKVGEVHAVVFDVTDPILNAVKDGTVDATIAQRTYLFTYLAVKLLHDYNHGNMENMIGVDKGVIPLPNIIDTGVIAVTKDSVDAYFSE
jgi:ribose transport system substrate-binding protein